ncbi:MMPL family transporter [Candidatus Woesearchaeota archaeon]|nr:MMPL family transporter [Candidatus Woesearchaeota archaeon]
MVSAKKLIDMYAHFLSNHPFVIIGLISVLLFISSITSSWIENKNMDYKGMLPDDVEVIRANNMFTDSFGSSESAMFVLEINPKTVSSNEVRDIRDARVFSYVDKLIQIIASSQEIEEVNSVVDTAKLMNNGFLPKDNSIINSYFDANPLMYNYVSKDYTMMTINLKLRENYNPDNLVYDMENAINSVPKLPGVSINLGGDSVADVIVDRELSPDMARTSMFSMIGIIIILIAIFGSLKFGLLPLTTIIVGIYLTMGFVGLAGIKMSSMTNGVISMIMGIGIDFGIQIINRFRQELRQKKQTAEVSMTKTLENTLWPMFTTTLAAVIGFKSMSMGQITIMSEMGNIMTFGVVFCFFTAITFVPALTIIIENLFSSRTKIKTTRRIKK